MKSVIRIIILVMIAIFLNGCGQGPNGKFSMFKQSPDTDVTSSAEYNFKSFAGTVWKTKVKVGLADLKAYTGRHETTLLAPEDFDPTHPKYRPPNDMQMIDVLPVGTRLRIDRLMKENGNWGGVKVTAVLEDGTHSQKTVYISDYLLAINRFIWAGSSDSKVWGADSDLLEKAE